MKALITGASSGMGNDMAKYLASKNIDLILVARRKDRLEKLKSELNVNVKIIELDLIPLENVYKLYESVKDDNIDILINNAGFGLFGKFNETDLNRELEMIDLNVRTYHVLTKLFLKDFYQKNSGFILNVCSSAGFLSGPNMATYYATKNYVTKLSLAIYEELNRQNKNISISILCPGPVNTEFNKVALGKFTINGLNSEYVSKYAIDKMFKHKLIIIPGISVKLGIFFSRFMPTKLLLKMIYNIQKRKKDV